MLTLLTFSCYIFKQIDAFTLKKAVNSETSEKGTQTDSKEIDLCLNFVRKTTGMYNHK